jgi:glycosyltransferase involved in cell wall biosynthesis
MKIGLPPHHLYRLDSVTYIFRMTTEVLKDKYELLYFPSEYDHCPRNRQEAIVRDWLDASDIVLGPIDHDILRVRHQMARKPPYICLLMGAMSRGGRVLLDSHELITEGDVLLGNCTGDVALTTQFVANAQIRQLPLAFDHTVFHPVGEHERAALRKKMGFSAEDNVLFYSGRMTIEKNVHTLLRVFSIVEKLVPNAHLLIAGTEFDAPFSEFGVYSVSIRSMLTGIVKRLNIKNVRFLGQQNREELGRLYNAADIAVNMTLHHDENFGLAQIEALGCGTPVAATQWGGLKDTVVDGKTGASISTIVTGAGVKVDWWEAANKIVELLRETKKSPALRATCARIAQDEYSVEKYGERLATVVDECGTSKRKMHAAIELTDFALEFWYRTAPRPGEKVPYRTSPQSLNLYRQMIQSFAGRMQTAKQGGLQDNQILCLGAPVYMVDNYVIIDDPIYPIELTIPPHLRQDITNILTVFDKKPALYVEAICTTSLPLSAALEWLIDNGVVLISACQAKIPSHTINGHMSKPFCTIHGIAHDTDIIYTR